MKRRPFRLLLSIGLARGSNSGVRIKHLGRMFLCAVGIAIALPACKPAQDPISVTITLLDPGWLERGFLDWRTHEMQQFKSETGIAVKLLPAPETEGDQLKLWRKLFQSPSEAPDVFAIDVIWPAAMAQYSMKLEDSLTRETAGDFPYLLPNDTVRGSVIAMPYHLDAGLLFYRTDLLSKYGYRAPPSTWDELETMAGRIQAGERAAGNHEFWGFVWQGAASEALTCNGLEWQASEGGGSILEKDGSVSVNNPRTIRAWERAAHWVGTISPPGVVAYREWDALNVWRTGNAAFMRNWPTAYRTSRQAGSNVADKFAVTLLPAGAAGRTGTMGGASLSIFRDTKYPKEATALVRFLCRRDVQRARAIATSQPPTFVDLYDDPEVLSANPHFSELKKLFSNLLAVRPSTVAGDNYSRVSQEYFQAVHSVLTHEMDAKTAAEKLQQELQHTGIEGKSGQ
jgi:trehalose/maltose transport system substrate-binding protein